MQQRFVGRSWPSEYKSLLHMQQTFVRWLRVLLTGLSVVHGPLNVFICRPASRSTSTRRRHACCPIAVVRAGRSAPQAGRRARAAIVRPRTVPSAPRGHARPIRVIVPVPSNDTGGHWRYWRRAPVIVAFAKSRPGASGHCDRPIFRRSRRSGCEKLAAPACLRTKAGDSRILQSSVSWSSVWRKEIAMQTFVAYATKVCKGVWAQAGSSTRSGSGEYQANRSFRPRFGRRG